MGRILTKEDVEYAVKGGFVYACGGGGWTAHGLELGAAAVAVGRPELVSIDELDPDAIVATSAAIGAPGESTEWEMAGIDYVKAVRLLEDALQKPVAGLMIGQNGASSTVNAWLPGAILGTKVVDAVGDLRAHPTGDMGSIGMAANPARSVQSAVGGNRKQGKYIEVVAKGATGAVSPVLRTAADAAGGFVASCRNPVPASYVKQYAVLGGISSAIALGKAIVQAEKSGPNAVFGAVCEATGGSFIAYGTVAKKNVAYTKEAFDVGAIELETYSKEIVTLHVMNEYMAVTSSKDGRVATYPDVITTFGEDGNPVSAGRVQEGDRLFVLRVPMDRIPLSPSVADKPLYDIVERSLGIAVYDYVVAGTARVFFNRAVSKTPPQ